MTIEATPQPVSMMPYALKFVGWYTLFTILVMVINTFLNFQSSSMGIVGLVVSCMPACQSFVKNTARAMSKGERVSFAVLGTVLALVVQVVLLVALLAISGVDISPSGISEMLNALDMPMSILIAVIAFAIVLSWVIIYFASGWMCKTEMKRLTKA